MNSGFEKNNYHVKEGHIFNIRDIFVNFCLLTRVSR